MDDIRQLVKFNQIQEEEPKMRAHLQIECMYQKLRNIQAVELDKILGKIVIEEKGDYLQFSNSGKQIHKPSRGVYHCHVRTSLREDFKLLL